MDYQTFEPNPSVNAFVKCYWTLTAPKEMAPQKQRIVPDGCMEMIFHHGDLFRQYAADDSFIVQPKCFVFGQITSTLDIEPTGETGIFAVRFQPAGFMPFVTLPIKQMENRAVSLLELFGEDALGLEYKILTASSTADRIAIIETFLMNKLIAPDAIDRVIKSSVETIFDLNGQLSVEELSEVTNTHRRKLERRFSTVIGLSPKQLTKIIRLQSAINTLLSTDFNSLTSVAYDADYFDQAHFVKDFKEFTGVSPKKFYAGHLKMSSLFSKL